MKRILLILSVLLSALSCDDQRLATNGSLRHRNRIPAHDSEEIRAGNDSTETEDIPEYSPTPHLYVAGVRYPDGYQWKKDSQYGMVDCTMFLMKDGETILELPVGINAELSSDQDMHHIVDGHLYTDYSTDDETVLKCDGKEIYRVRGREMLRELAVLEGDVYTLCESRQGKSLRLRKNGEEMFMAYGVVTSGLVCHEGHISFCYRTTTGYDILVTDGRGEVIYAPEGVRDVNLCKLADGKILRICDNRIIFDGKDKKYSLTDTEGIVFKNLLNEGNDIYAVGEIELSDSTATTISFRNGRLDHSYKRLSYYSSFLKDGRLWMVGYDGVSSLYAVMNEGTVIWLGGKWRPFSPSAADLHDGILRLALCSDDGPAIWDSDGGLQTFPFNGYIDRIVTLME